MAKRFHVSRSCNREPVRQRRLLAFPLVST